MKLLIILSILLTGIMAHPRHMQAETLAQRSFSGLYEHMERVR